MWKTATGICIALALAAGFFWAGYGVGRAGAGATTASQKQEEPYGSQGQPPPAASGQPAGREGTSDQAFYRQLAAYVEKTRPIIPDSGEKSFGSIPSKVEHKYALPAVIVLNHYLAEQQYETWSAWPEHPDEPVLVHYEILDPESGGMYTPWIYSIGVRLYWAIFKQNPRVANKLSYEQNGMVTYEEYPAPAPAKTWYENVIFSVTPDPPFEPSAEEPVDREGKIWTRQEYGGKGWKVKRSVYRSGDPLPPGVEKEVETKGLPMLFDIPFPPEYRGDWSGTPEGGSLSADFELTPAICEEQEGEKGARLEPPRPETRQLVTFLDGREERVSFRLLDDPSLPFTTYIPAGWRQERGGFGIAVKSIRESNRQWTVSIEETSPPPDAITIAAITHLAQFVAVEVPKGHEPSSVQFVASPGEAWANLPVRK